MAKLYVTEFQALAAHYAQAPQEPCVADQTPVVIGAGSLQSAAFNAKTRLVRIHTDAICSIAFGENPTATANMQRLAAGQTEFRVVAPGHKIAVITNT
jgi:hypothetical protein